MIDKQHVPLLDGFVTPAWALMRPALHHAHFRARPTEGEGSTVAGIFENLAHSAQRGSVPHNLAAPRCRAEPAVNESAPRETRSSSVERCPTGETSQRPPRSPAVLADRESSRSALLPCAQTPPPPATAHSPDGPSANTLGAPSAAASPAHTRSSCLLVPTATGH